MNPAKRRAEGEPVTADNTGSGSNDMSPESYYADKQQTSSIILKANQRQSSSSKLVLEPIRRYDMWSLLVSLEFKTYPPNVRRQPKPKVESSTPSLAPPPSTPQKRTLLAPPAPATPKKPTSAVLIIDVDDVLSPSTPSTTTVTPSNRAEKKPRPAPSTPVKPEYIGQKMSSSGTRRSKHCYIRAVITKEFRSSSDAEDDNDDDETNEQTGASSSLLQQARENFARVIKQEEDSDDTEQQQQQPTEPIQMPIDYLYHKAKLH